MLGDALEVGFESRLSSTALHAATFFLEELMEMLSNFLGVRPEQKHARAALSNQQLSEAERATCLNKKTQRKTRCSAADYSTACLLLVWITRSGFPAIQGLRFDKRRRLHSDTGSERESFERLARKRATSVNETSGLVKDSGQMLQRSYWYREVVATGRPVPLYRFLVSAKDSGNG